MCTLIFSIGLVLMLIEILSFEIYMIYLMNKIINKNFKMDKMT